MQSFIQKKNVIYTKHDASADFTYGRKYVDTVQFFFFS